VGTNTIFFNISVEGLLKTQNISWLWRKLFFVYLLNTQYKILYHVFCIQDFVDIAILLTNKGSVFRFPFIKVEQWSV